MEKQPSIEEIARLAKTDFEVMFRNRETRILVIQWLRLLAAVKRIEDERPRSLG